MRAHDSPAPDGSRPWRKRHPVLARALLYGLGLSLAAGGTYLWLERRDQDRADRVRYLWARLEALPVVLQTDPDGTETSRVLEAEFADPDLPDDLEARAERLRGVVARLRGDASAMDRAFFRARNLDVSAASVEALTLEWAQCRIDLKDLPGARELLNAPHPRDPVLALWRPVIQAHLSEAAGQGEEARIGLLTVVDTLPKPLPQVPPVWFLLNVWRLEDVLIEAVRWMAAGLPPDSGQAPPLWRRLPELAPQYLPALIAAAEGLVAAKDTMGARGIWSRVKQLDPVFAVKQAARNPALGALDGP